MPDSKGTIWVGKRVFGTAMAVSSKSLTIRPVTTCDARRWETLRNELWPAPDGEHRGEIAAFFAHALTEPEAVLVAESHHHHVVGFVELSVRNDLAGLEGRAVGYVEGMYVIPEYRNGGIARRLLRASTDWAHDRSCEFFGSDRADRIIIDPGFRKNPKTRNSQMQDPRMQDHGVPNAKDAERVRP